MAEGGLDKHYPRCAFDEAAWGQARPEQCWAVRHGRAGPGESRVLTLATTCHTKYLKFEILYLDLIMTLRTDDTPRVIDCQTSIASSVVHAEHLGDTAAAALALFPSKLSFRRCSCTGIILSEGLVC